MNNPVTHRRVPPQTKAPMVYVCVMFLFFPLVWSLCSPPPLYNPPLYDAPPPPTPPFMCPGTQAQQAFRTEPRNLTVHKGATAVLKCEVLRASGTVQWVKDGLLLGPQQSLPGFPRYSMIGSPKRGKQTRNKVYGLLDLNGPIRAEEMDLRKAGPSKVTLESFIIDLPGLFVFINIQRARRKLHSSRKFHLSRNRKRNLGQVVK